jgi:hypothetical protein
MKIFGSIDHRLTEAASDSDSPCFCNPLASDLPPLAFINIKQYIVGNDLVFPS